MISHEQEILDAIERATNEALKRVGMRVTKYAKALAPVGTPESTGKKGYIGGTLRNSIDYSVHDNMVTIGSNVEYAPYVELGTGPYFEAPPSWEKFETKQGSGGGHGYVRPRPYLRPAVTDHLDEYNHIISAVFHNYI